MPGNQRQRESHQRELGRQEHRTSRSAGGRGQDRGSAGRGNPWFDDEDDLSSLRRYDGYDDEDQDFGRGWRWYQQADRNASRGEDHPIDFGDPPLGSRPGGGFPGVDDCDT